MLTVPQQTDGRTDGRTTYDSNTALARASHGKKIINSVGRGKGEKGSPLAFTLYI